MGVWIEITTVSVVTVTPSVTPLVGVWIEIKLCAPIACLGDVTPLVGVWIEIILVLSTNPQYLSRPSWACGLKCL